MPEALKNARSQQSSMPAKPPSSTFVAGGGPTFSHHAPSRDRDDRGSMDYRPPERPNNFGHSDGGRPSFVPASTNEPEFGTFEEAEASFMKLLKRYGVQQEWTWPQAMKAVI